jgi:hypothetical protein
MIKIHDIRHLIAIKGKNARINIVRIKICRWQARVLGQLLLP